VRRAGVCVLDLDSLNPQQREAVESVDGPLLILAGAGSGKTRVITFRIAHLIESRNVAPDSILAVTFTNKAAKEMAERVDQLIGMHSLARPQISTFHSLCVRLLRRDIQALQINGRGYTRDFVIYDEGDQQILVKSALKRLGIDDKKLKPNAILGYISSAKNRMVNPQELFLDANDPKAEKIAQIYKIYEEELIKANALDFDDLLLKTVSLLKASARVRERLQRQYKYLLIDEYQDTNRPQYEIMHLLTGERQNICAVGDEDQSIYSWRGADIHNILDFERDFKNAKVIRLEQNYRSTQPILQGASAVVANNQQRKGKTLWTAKQGGSLIGLYEAPDGENEALFVADRISKWQKDHLGDAAQQKSAILYRTNAQSRLMEEALRRYGLPYHVVGGFSFYERAEIKDMIGYLKLILNLDDSVALMRVVNTPTRGIGKSTMETLERIAIETGLSLWRAIGEAIDRGLLPNRALVALKGFRELIEDSRSMLWGDFAAQMTASAAGLPAASVTAPVSTAPMIDEEAPAQHGFNFEAADASFDINDFAADEPAAPADAPAVDDSFDVADFGAAAEPAEPSEGEDDSPVIEQKCKTGELLKYILSRTGYLKALEQEDTPDAEARIENIKELVNAALDSDDRGEGVGGFLDSAALSSDADQFDESQKITLMTLHAAKGLEFPLVCLVGVEEGLFPHSRTLMSPDEMEEERRLCYVGMTRAMQLLIMTRAHYRRRWGAEAAEPTVASRFLGEIPQELIEDLGTPMRGYSTSSRQQPGEAGVSRHFSDEDEDQSQTWTAPWAAAEEAHKAKNYNSAANIESFFAARGLKLPEAKSEPAAAPKARAWRKGDHVCHPKWGEGVIYQREGAGEMAKITVQFNRYGLKKLVEKFAQLEKA